MGSKRTIILVAALVIGALAAVSLYSYVNNIEDRAYQGANPVALYVVAAPLEAGTSGQAAIGSGAIVAKNVPQEFMPDNAVTDLNTITAKLAKTKLEKGQIVVSSMFVDPVDVTSSWVDQLGADEVAVMVNLDQVRGMNGIVQPGDRVTMMVTLEGTEGQSATATANVVQGGSVQFLYSNIYVLAVGGTGVSTSGSAAAPTAGPITFRVPLEAAQKISLANTKLWLVLEPKGFVPKDSDLTPVDWTNLFTGEKSPYPAGSNTSGDAAAAPGSATPSAGASSGSTPAATTGAGATTTTAAPQG